MLELRDVASLLKIVKLGYKLKGWMKYLHNDVPDECIDRLREQVDAFLKIQILELFLRAKDKIGQKLQWITFLLFHFVLFSQVRKSTWKHQSTSPPLLKIVNNSIIVRLKIADKVIDPEKNKDKNSNIPKTRATNRRGRSLAFHPATPIHGPSLLLKTANIQKKHDKIQL